MRRVLIAAAILAAFLLAYSASGPASTATFATTGGTTEVFAIGDSLTIDADSAYNSAADLIINLWGWRS